MRTIKFRAWHKVNKVMHNDVHLLNDFSNMLAQPDRYQVMQFTGIKDKNKKEIYDGDIMTSDGDKAFDCIVKFEDGSFCRQLITSSRPFYYDVNLSSTQFHDEMHNKKTAWEIIGNIYQNPELLKP